jgi:hypothetical protein
MMLPAGRRVVVDATHDQGGNLTKKILLRGVQSH